MGWTGKATNGDLRIPARHAQSWSQIGRRQSGRRREAGRYPRRRTGTRRCRRRAAWRRRPGRHCAVAAAAGGGNGQGHEQAPGQEAYKHALVSPCSDGPRPAVKDSSILRSLGAGIKCFPRSCADSSPGNDSLCRVNKGGRFFGSRRRTATVTDGSIGQSPGSDLRLNDARRSRAFSTLPSARIPGKDDASRERGGFPGEVAMSAAASTSLAGRAGYELSAGA